MVSIGVGVGHLACDHRGAAYSRLYKNGIGVWQGG